jgi:hypothetical protein
MLYTYGALPNASPDQRGPCGGWMSYFTVSPGGPCPGGRGGRAVN